MQNSKYSISKKKWTNHLKKMAVFAGFRRLRSGQSDAISRRFISDSDYQRIIDGLRTCIMKRTRQKLEDSDDDMDLPLKYISSGCKRISIDELRKYSVHPCEFCEKSFENRYDYLIHNARHIIIPLIKMLPYYCNECSLYCLSQEEMNDHMSIKHKRVIEEHSPNINTCKIELERLKLQMNNNDDQNADEKPLNCLNNTLKKEKTAPSDGTENILKNFVLNCKVDVEKFVPPLVNQSDDKDIKPDKHGTDIKLIKNENNFIQTVRKFDPSLEQKNVTKNYTVNYNNEVVEFKTATVNDRGKGNFENSDNAPEFSDLDEDPIVILAPVKKEIVTEHHGRLDSIHFTDLIKPGIFNCKRCFKRFPNRYEVIVHEATHMDLSKTALKSCKVKHEEHAAGTRNKVLTCSRCHEQIKDRIEHAKTCFRLTCTACGQGFNNKKPMDIHVDKCNGEAVVHMCDTCLYCRNKPKHVQYFGIVRLNELPEKRTCDWCGKLCKMMSLVTLISKQRLVDRIRFESDGGGKDDNVDLRALCRVKQTAERRYTGASERGRGRGSKTLSNRERLKMIQHRLKLMKK